LPEVLPDYFHAEALEFVGRLIMKNFTTNQHERHEPLLRNLDLKYQAISSWWLAWGALLKLKLSRFTSNVKFLAPRHTILLIYTLRVHRWACGKILPKTFSINFRYPRAKKGR
jgi:hypothetical protein